MNVYEGAYRILNDVQADLVKGKLLLRLNNIFNNNEIYRR